jgi:hypothetical protein
VETPPGERPTLALIETVRCLECGILYSKPAGGGTVGANPGCPLCGYVGWVPATLPVTDVSRRRSDADLQLPPRARSG